MKRAAALAAMAIVILVHLAANVQAVDLLSTQVELGTHDARLLVRSADGIVHVKAYPEVLVAAGGPEGEHGAYASTPTDVDASHVWHGLDGVVVLSLRRADPAVAIVIIVEDRTEAGLWIDWSAAQQQRAIPGGLPVAALAIGSLAWQRRRRRS